LEEDAAGGYVGIEPEDVLRAHPGPDELDLESGPERRHERAAVQAWDPCRHGLHPVLVRLRDCRGHQTRAQRGVLNAAGPDRTVPADHDVAHSLAVRPRLIEPRTLGDRHEVALVGIASRLPESAIESCRYVTRPLGRDSCGAELS